MADGNSLDGLAEKLDILIRLQATAMVDRFATQREKISFLSRAGLPPRSIAEILGTSSNSVSVALSKMKKENGKDGEGKD